MNRGVITLDGPAGSGKSTLATMIAQKYPFHQIDSGALYRTFTFIALEKIKLHNHSECVLSENLINTHIDEILSAKIKLAFKENAESGAQQIVLYNDKELGNEIRENVITSNIKSVADHIQIRKRVNEIIRKVAEKYSVIADGRDMGSVVFPNADIQFFITASPEIRAKRRYDEMIEKKMDANYEGILQSIIDRDRQDMNREFGGLKQPANAIFIDTTTMNLNIAFQQLEKVILGKFKALK